MIVSMAAAGSCILLGGAIAKIGRIRPAWLENELRHSVIAFGGGALVSAVALVLVPEGNNYVDSPVTASLSFLSGGLVVFLLERRLGIRRRETPQLSAMLLDYLPESLALGGMFAIGSPSAPLLAILIGLQNLPEGFNAYRELVALPSYRPRQTLLMMALLIPLGPLFGVIGWIYGPSHVGLVGGIMLFSAGGILYLLFQDIAPQSRLDRHWGPALGAVAGFTVGMLGQLLLEGS